MTSIELLLEELLLLRRQQCDQLVPELTARAFLLVSACNEFMADLLENLGSGEDLAGDFNELAEVVSLSLLLGRLARLLVGGGQLHGSR